MSLELLDYICLRETVRERVAWKQPLDPLAQEFGISCRGKASWWFCLAVSDDLDPGVFVELHEIAKVTVPGHNGSHQFSTPIEQVIKRTGTARSLRILI